VTKKQKTEKNAYPKKIDVTRMLKLATKIGLIRWSTNELNMSGMSVGAKGPFYSSTEYK
jgi:hypothetical protein